MFVGQVHGALGKNSHHPAGVRLDSTLARLVLKTRLRALQDWL